MIGIPLSLKPPRDQYVYGWGQDCHDPKSIVCTWELTVCDIKNNPCALQFDLVNGSSPLVIGLDIGKYADSVNLTDVPHIRIKRPGDDTILTFNTYITPDSPGNPDCVRVRVALLPRPPTEFRHPITTMLSKLHKTVSHDPVDFARKVHRYTHVHPDQLKHICESAGILSVELEDAIDNTTTSCELCARHGRPLPSKKISLSHVNEEFNEEVQVDFIILIVYRTNPDEPSQQRREKYTVLVMTDTGTRYTEAVLVEHRSIPTIITAYENSWLYRHGASKYLSADDEYHRKSLILYLTSHDIQFKARPTRRHNKLGIVERKNGTLKNILRKIAMEYSSAPMSTIVARGAFLCNLFSGNQLLSSFELARGYQPSLLGIPTSFVTQDLLDAHTHQVAIRALQRVLRSRNPNVPTPGMFKTGDTVWVWYATSKQNEDDQWIRATVVTTRPHFLEVRRIKNGRICKGPTMKPAYEDVRVAPRHDLAQQLMECSLETALGYGESSERGLDDTQGANDASAPQVSSLLNTNSKPQASEVRKKSALDDLGAYANNIKENANMIATLQSDRARILESIYNEIGSHQVSRHKLEFAPPWILDEAFDKEYTSNWDDAYEPIDEKDLPPDANVITSHTVYKVKTTEDGSKTMKGRIVPHGNRDEEKDSIRKDSATAQLNVIRLLLSLVTFLGLRLATADIKGAYLQSSPINRDIYVRPPKEWYTKPGRKRGTLWKLTKLPYGIVEAGRQWQKTVEEWMLSGGGLQRVFGLSQLFIRRDKQGYIVMLVAKVTDDFLVGGKLDYVHEFMDRLQQRFTVRKVLVDKPFYFNGCEIEQDAKGNIRMSMERYWERLKKIEVSRTRRKLRALKANEDEERQYRALAGTLLYLGNGVLPQASLVVSLMQQKLANLTVQHLIDANDMLTELAKLNPWISFRRPNNTANVEYCTFSDASHPHNKDYGQTGIIGGLRISNHFNSSTIFHVIDWTSHKQHRVSYSSYGAEILAAATGDDRGFYFKTAINNLFPHVQTRHELIVDSHALYDTITTLHESTEYRLRPTVQRIRNSFESNELESLRWIPGTVNVADALTKRSRELSIALNQICSTGYLEINLEVGECVLSALWK